MMMRNLIILMFVFINSIVKAQLDTEHYFAPMFMTQTNAINQTRLYLSTNEVTPFAVQVYNNEVVFATVNVSKGNPVEVIVPNDYITTASNTFLFKSTSMGIKAIGTNKFFANLRFDAVNHAEIITSKGKAALGNTFYVAHAPMTVSSTQLSFTASVLATEDNTVVTITGYNPLVVFNSPTALVLPLTINLNKGQSYTVSGNSTPSANWSGFIGAKVESTKPVTLTNGNFNGQYSDTSYVGSDILMDQSVPIERLGNEFVLISGNSMGSNMERALVVATENNTQVFVNNNPVAVAVINIGQYYFMPENAFQNKGNSHYNAYIKTDKNVYVYQMLAGASGGSVTATGGFNYIPPLNCYLPKSIDEISKINELNGSNYNAKLNIITQKGGVITVNGAALPASSGPYPVSGTIDWESYSVPNITGNITVNSTKSLTAGIASGNGAVGYGGYFAGFSSVPVITKQTGTCVPGIVLEVNNGFDYYQWQLNNVNIPGATSNTYTPAQAGNFTCLVTNGTCPQVLTPTFKVFSCPTNSALVRDVCNVTQFTPIFTNSAQTVNNAGVTITTPPIKGVAVVNNATGQITYTVNPGATGTDSFSYSFCSTTPEFFDCENVTVTLSIGELISNNSTLTACETSANAGVFNLVSANVTSATPVVKTYYTNLADAQGDVVANQIATPNAFTSGPAIVFVKLRTPLGCTSIAQVQLSLFEKAVLTTNNYNSVICDDDLDGNITVDFSTITPQILGNSANFVSKYYLNQADAIAGNANTLPNSWTFAVNTIVYVRIESTNGCPAVLGQINFQKGAKTSLLNTAITQFVCDDNFDNNIDVNLSDYNNQFSISPGLVFTYYNTLADANNGTNAIPSTQTLSSNSVYYVRIVSPNACPNVAKLNINLGAKVALIGNGEKIISVCDNNVDGSENIVLSDYFNQLTTDAVAIPSYYATLLDAQLGTNPVSINQTISNNISFYVRFVKQGVCASIGVLRFEFGTLLAINNNGVLNVNICDENFNGSENVVLSDYQNQLTAQVDVTATYFATTANAQNNVNPIVSNQTISVNTSYFVRLSKSGFCPNIAEIKFVFGESVGLIGSGEVEIVACDDDFDGNISVNLQNYTNQLTAETGATSTYYISLANAQNSVNPINPVQNINANTVYFVRLKKVAKCDVVGKIAIVLGNKIALLSGGASSQIICDSDLNGQETVNLNDYVNQLTAEPGVSVTVYNSLADAQNNTNPINATQTINSNKTYFYRFQKAGLCPNVAKIDLLFKQSKASTELSDKTICPESTIELNAGAGYDAYHWSTGATTANVTVGVGNYWVDLSLNGCVYRQIVKVNNEILPVITHIDVNHTTVTISATGSHPPYLYSLDNVHYQSSNVFVNVPYGIQDFYVKSANSLCQGVTRNAYILLIPNAITPNDDGYNDVLDYTKLGIMKNVHLEVFDRYGKKVYKNTNNTPIWDGKFEGKPVKTDSYWYMLKWEDPNGYQLQYSGWILVKNRD